LAFTCTSQLAELFVLNGDASAKLPAIHQRL
jgi:hypothetical protein